MSTIHEVERELEHFDRDTLLRLFHLLSCGLDAALLRELVADARQHPRFEPKAYAEPESA